MFEIIKHKRPSLILCENVSGHIVLGLDEVLLDLEGEGYSTRAFVIPASAVDANHKRERVWIVANTDSRMRRGGRAIKSSGENKQRRIHTTQEKQTSHDIRSETIGCDTVRGEAEDVANTNNNGHKKGFSETRNQNDDGKNTQSERTTNTKIIERHSNDGDDKETTRVDATISRSSDGGEALLTTTEGICSVSKGTNKYQGIDRENNHQENNDRTLVSQGSKGVQLPKYRKLGDNKTLSKSSKIQQGDDNSRKHRMDNETTNVANTQSFGSDGREYQHDTEENREKGAIGSKVRRESSTENVANSQDIRHEFSTYEEKQKWDTTRHSQGKLERDGADVPNTQGKGLEGQRIDRETSRDKEPREFDAQSGKANVSDTNSQRGFSGETRNQDAEDVGQQSRSKEHRQGSIERRLGGVVDGVSSWMDEPDIPRVTTNQTGRVQRLKMLGNAVVPQVVYQLGLAMKELWDEV
jgi:site-specific DNA-cytosine methylase